MNAEDFKVLAALNPDRAIWFRPQEDENGSDNAEAQTAPD